MRIQLPNDAKATGYKETRPFHHEQVFRSEQYDFEGTEKEFVAAGYAYEYTPISGYGVCAETMRIVKVTK